MAEGAAPHILWKGYLKLSLVSCAIAVIPSATSTGSVSLTTLNRATGSRVRRRYVDPVTGDAVEPEDQVKGYAVGKDRYVTVTEEELDSIELESTHTIDIRLFVPAEEIDPVWTAGSHYIVPDDPVAVEAYSVIRAAMEQEGLVGIGRVVLHRRERRCVVSPRGRGLLMTVLRYPYEVRDDGPVQAAIPETPVPGDMLDLAERLIDERTGPFEPDQFTDRYTEALNALVAAKMEQQAPPRSAQPARQPGKVINLMDALRASIAAEKTGKPAAASPARGGRKAGGTSRKKDAPAAKADASPAAAGQAAKAPRKGAGKGSSPAPKRSGSGGGTARRGR